MNGLLGDLPQFQDEMRGMQVLNQPVQQQQQQPRGDVSFLEKMAIALAPTAYSNIQNVKTMRQQQAGTQGMDLPSLVDYWSTRDPQKAQQYANILQQQKAQQAEQARQQSMQEVLGGVAPTQATGNQGYSEQAENLARAGIQLMQRGDLVGGEALIKQAEQLQKLRTQRETVNLGNRVEMVDPYQDKTLSIGVSPDAQLSAATTRRGQDLAQQQFYSQLNNSGGGGESFVEGRLPTPKGKLTGEQRKALGFGDRMLNAEQILAEVPNGLPDAGTQMAGAIPLVGNLARNAAMTPDQQKYYNAAQEWIRAKLRKESGAVIGDQEAKDEFRTYFPMPGDSKETIAQKAKLRQFAIGSLAREAGTYYDPAGVTQPKPSVSIRRYNPITGMIE